MSPFAKPAMGAIAIAMTLAACSTQSAIDKMASPAEKQLAIGFAEALCDGSLKNYKEQIEPKVWSESQSLFPQAKSYCPKGKGKSRLMGYHFSVNTISGRTTKQAQMVVVSESPGKWTITTLVVSNPADKLQIVAWNIAASREKPAEIAAWDRWDSIVGYLQFGIPLLLLTMIGGVFWFYRRAKRNEAG